MPTGQQSGQSAAMAGFGQRPRLLPRAGEWAPRPGVAEGKPGLLAQGPQGAAQKGWRVTRSLRAASHCPGYRYGHLTAGRVTRRHLDARFCADWTYRQLNRFDVTREHRLRHRASDTLGPTDSRPKQRETERWRSSNECCVHSGCGGYPRSSVGSITAWFGIGTSADVRPRRWRCICSWSPSPTATG